MKRIIAALFLASSLSFFALLMVPPALADPDAVTHCGSNAPCPRCCMGIALDLDHPTTSPGQLILFGGTDNFGRTLGDTWTYDLTNGGWSWHNISSGPCPRHSTRMAYDELRQVAVMFGGDGACSGPDVTLNDTWAWTGSGWSQLCQTGCSTIPSSRQSFGLAWDRADHYVLLFGGNGCGGYCGDTWKWNGTVWTQVCTGCTTGGTGATTPNARRNVSLAFSAVRNGGLGEVILTAGEESTGIVDGTWRWAGGDGTDGQWHGVTGANSPSPRTTHRMAYDENTGLIMLFGGCTLNCDDYSHATMVADQFSLGTTSWSSVTVTRPSKRCCVGLVYASRSPFSSLSNAPGIFLFGGADRDNNGLGDMYFYTGGAWCKVTGTTTCSSSW